MSFGSGARLQDANACVITEPPHQLREEFFLRFEGEYSDIVRQKSQRVDALAAVRSHVQTEISVGEKVLESVEVVLKRPAP
jgi:hypothetical protein